MFLKNLIEKIGNIGKAIAHLFTSLFTSAETIYNELEPVEQEAVQKAQGILGVISKFVGSDALTVVWPAIQQLFPSLTEAEVTNLLGASYNILNTAQQLESPTLEGAIQAWQAYLAPKTGNEFATIMQAATNLIAGQLIPAETPIQRITAVGEWVYQTIIKPLLDKVTAPATNTTVAATGTEAAATGTEAAATGTEAAATGTEAAATGTEAAATGTEVAATGTEVAATGTEVAATGTEVAATGTEVAATGTEVAATGTEVAATGLQTDVSNGVQ